MLDPDVEGVLGRSLLGKVDLGIRITLSRTTRPGYLQSPSTLGEQTSVSPPITVESGQMSGWVVLAHKETQLQIGDGYDNPVTAKHVLHAGVVFSERTFPDDTTDCSCICGVMLGSRLFGCR